MRTFKDANQAGELLNVHYRQNLEPKDYVTRSFLNKMKSGLEDSIDKSSESYPELADLRNKAKNARIEQAKFEKGPDGKDTPFIKIYNKVGSRDTGKFISQHIKAGSGADDRSEFIKQLTENVSPDTRKAIATKAISPKGNETIAQQMKNLGKYSPEEQQALFGEDAQDAEHLNFLQSLYPEGRSPGYVPKTGFQAGKTGGGMAFAAGLGAALKSGNIPATLGLATIPAISRGAPALLRSKFLRDLYIKGLEQTPEVASAVKRTAVRSPVQELSSRRNK